MCVSEIKLKLQLKFIVITATFIGVTTVGLATYSGSRYPGVPAIVVVT